MKRHFECPACNKQFSFLWLVLKLTRIRFFCPSCKTFLKVSGVGIYLTLMLFMMGFLGVLYLQRSYALGLTPNFLILLVLVVIYEIAASLLVCNKGKFSYTKKSKKAESLQE